MEKSLTKCPSVRLSFKDHGITLDIFYKRYNAQLQANATEITFAFRAVLAALAADNEQPSL